jgi:hypothetical protein
MSKEDRIYIPIITNLGITSKKVKKKSVDFMAILDYKAPTLGKVRWSLFIDFYLSINAVRHSNPLIGFS